MKLAAYNKLQARAVQLQKELSEINTQLEQFRLETLRTVPMKRNNYSTTLTHNGRTLNVTRNMWGHTQVKEKGKLITTMHGNIHDVRFAVALGQL